MMNRKPARPTRLIRQVCVAILVMITLTIPIPTSWAKDGAINAGGKELDTLFRFKKGVKYLPVEKTCAALGMSASRDGNDWIIKGTFRGEFRAEGNKKGFIEKDRMIFAPVPFWQKELGLEVCEKGNTVYVVNRIHEVKTYPEGLLVITAAPIDVESFELENPSRSVYDIPYLAIGSDKPEIQYKFDNQPFSSIRIGQFNKFPHTGRFVVDIGGNSSFKPIQSIHGPSKNVLWIGRTQYYEPVTPTMPEKEKAIDTTLSVKVEADGSVILSGIRYEQAKLEHLWTSKPYRVVCDLYNCELAVKTEQEFAGKGDVIRVRLAQNSETVARLVVELNNPVTMQIAESSGDRIKLSPLVMNSNFKRGFKVLIDAGHGGHDTGAQVFKKEMGGLSANEKDVNLRLALILGSILESRGVQVFYTRTDDRFLDLVTRREMAIRLGVDLFVSIHTNATPHRPQFFVSGPEVYYFSPRDKKLAEAIWRHMSQRTGIQGRGNLFGRLCVIMNEKVPSVLVEAGYLNNPNDLAKILNVSSGYCEAAMTGVADGVSEVYGIPMSAQKVSPVGIQSTDTQKPSYVKTEERIGRKITMFSFDYNPYEIPSRDSRDTSSEKREPVLKKEETNSPQIFKPIDMKKDLVEKEIVEEQKPDVPQDLLNVKIEKEQELVIVGPEVETDKVLVGEGEKKEDEKILLDEKEIKKRKSNIFKLY